MLNWLKENALGARAKLTAEVSKFRNKAFMEAVVAACAMVAAADGKVDPAEKRKMADFIRSAEELRHFEMTAVIAVFEKIMGSMEFDVQIGHAEALKLIGRVRENREQARLLVRVACAISAADGTFDHSERDTVRAICRELNLDPADFDL